MNPIISQALAYGIVLVICIFIISFLLRGFFWSYISVRFMNGDRQKVLVKVRTINKPFYKVAKIVGGDLVFKVGKDERRYSNIPKSAIYNDLNINWVEIDDLTGAVVIYDGMFKGVSGFDPDKMNSLYLRALYKPQIVDPLTTIMIVLLIVIVLICFYNAYAIYTVDKKVTAIQRITSLTNNYLFQNTSNIL